MALKDIIPLGMSLPHRSPDPIDMATVRRVAERAEALGFSDLWVTENTLDHVFSFDPAAILTYAAAVTTRIRLAVAVVVLPTHNPSHVANSFATLDYISNGRAILGLGLGREHHYREFQIPVEHRVRRFREGVEIIKALWTQDKVDYWKHLSARRGRHGIEAGAEAASADLARRQPPRRRPPCRSTRRWMDSGGRVEHGRVRKVR